MSHTQTHTHTHTHSNRHRHAHGHLLTHADREKDRQTDTHTHTLTRTHTHGADMAPAILRDKQAKKNRQTAAALIVTIRFYHSADSVCGGSGGGRGWREPDMIGQNF